MLLKSKSRVSATKGDNGEIFGVLLELTNPRARLSRAESRLVLYSCIGEFLWYMAGSNSLDYIKHFISRYKDFAEADGTIHGAYGPRLFNKDGVNQIAHVIKKLREKKDSRKAVIQLYDAQDTIKEYKDVPCTCTLQFVVRRGYLHMMTHMRSNDAYMGLPHDIFCFTMIQELIAGSVGAKLGKYKHSVGSLHLYDRNAEAAEQFLAEGFQDEIPMPAMPQGDQWEQIKLLIDLERTIRERRKVDLEFPPLHPYWADIARLMAIWSAPDSRSVVKIKGHMKSKVYETYIRKKHDRLKPKADDSDIFRAVEEQRNG